MLYVAWNLLKDEPFFPWDSFHFWKVFPTYSDWHANPSHYLYYMFQLGFYFQGLLALVTFETRRKDFVELFLHHWVTIFLIIFSYCASQHRIGLNVLIIHDISDIFLYSTKVFHYVDKFGRFHHFLLNGATQVAFILFAVSFAVSRNYIYPAYVVYPSLRAGNLLPWVFDYTPINARCPGDNCLYLAAKTITGGPSTDSTGILSQIFLSMHYVYDGARTNWFEISHLATCFGKHCFHSGYVLIWLMVLLELLHVFWLVLIIRMVYRAVIRKEVKQDIRSDEENEEEWNDAKHKKKIE